MNIDEQAAADAIMSARHSDAFTKEACVQIFRDAATKEKTYESRVIELFGSWLDHWSTKVNREMHEVYGAWDECREVAQKEAESHDAAQPKPEPWQKIAREAAGIIVPNLKGWLMLRSDVEAIILSAIERSHAAQPQPSKASPLGERSEHEHGEGFCIHRGATSDQPPVVEEYVIGDKDEMSVRIPQRDQPPSSAKTTDDKPRVFKMDAEGYGVSPSGVRLLKPEMAVKEANAALDAERQKRDRITVDSQSWGGLRLEWRESEGRHYLYDKYGIFLWSGEPSYNIWKCVKLTKEFVAERQRNRELQHEIDRLNASGAKFTSDILRI